MSNSIQESFDKLTDELESVMNDTLNVVVFDKCLIADGSCQIPAECVASINGKVCDCYDLNQTDSQIGFDCTCF